MDLIDNDELLFMYGHAGLGASFSYTLYLVITTPHVLMWRRINPHPETRLWGCGDAGVDQGAVSLQ